MPHRRTGRPVGRPPGSITTAKSEIELFGALHRQQAKFWYVRQQQLRKLIKDLPPGEKIPTPIVEEMQQIDEFLQRASASMVKVQEAYDKVFAGMSTEQLEAQMRAEFIASSNTWTDSEWAVVEQARNKRLAAIAKGKSE